MCVRKAMIGAVALAAGVVTAKASVIAHWQFDEASGTVASDSVGGFDGTLQGASSFVPDGVSGNALSLTSFGTWNPNNGRVDAGSTSALDFAGAKFSASYWLNVSSGSSGGLFYPIARMQYLGAGWWSQVSTLAYFFMAINGSGGIGTSGVSDPASVTDDEWHHLVVSYDATDADHAKAAVWVDGRLEDYAVNDPNFPLQNRVAVFPSTPGAHFVIGGHGDDTYGTWGWMNGKIDDVQIYDEFLGGEQVETLRQNPGLTLAQVPEPSLAGMLAVGICALLSRRRYARCLD